MSKTVTIDGKQYTVPDDATLEEIEAFIAASSPQLHGPELAAQREAEALQARAASFAPAGDPLAKPGAMARKPDLFDAAMADPNAYNSGARNNLNIPTPLGSVTLPGGYKSDPLNQQAGDILGAGADFLMAPLSARNTGGADPTNALAKMVTEPLARLPEALVRDPLKTIAQDYNPIYQMGMGYKDVEGAAASALQGDFGAAGTQALEGVTEMLGGGLGLVGVRGGPKVPGSTMATSLAQAKRMAADTRASFLADAPAAAAAAAPEPPPAAAAAAMSYEDVAELVRKAARGGMGSQQAAEALARAAPINKAAAAAADRLGIDVPVDVLLDHTQLKEAVGLTRSMPGTLASSAWADAVTRAAGQADDAMAMIDGSADLSYVDHVVQESMTTTRNNLEAQAKVLYKSIDDKIEGKAPPVAKAAEAAPEAPAAAARPDPTLAMITDPGDQIAYINKKYPPAAPNMQPPYFVAANALKRAAGDRAAATKELADYAAYLRQTKSKPAVIENAERAVRAVADVDPIYFDDAAFNASMKSKIEAVGTAAMEQAGVAPPKPAAKPASVATPTVDLVNSRKLMNDVVTKLDDLSSLTPLEKNLMEMSSAGRAKPPTYAAFMRLKNDVGQAVEKASGPYADMNAGILKRLYAAMREDQLHNVERIGGKQLRTDMELANQIWQKKKALEDSMVSLFGRDQQGSVTQKLLNTIKTGAKGDITGFNRIVDALPADLRKKAVASAIAAASRESKTEGFGFAKFVTLYQGLRENSVIFKKVAETLGPDSEQFLNDLYKISKRITDARANVKTTGQANQALVQGIMAEGLVQKVMGSTFGRMATMGGATAVGGAAAGPIVGASSAMLVNALSKTSKKSLNAAGDLFASPEWQQLVSKLAAEDRVDKRAFNAARTSKAFITWTKTAGITDPDNWLRNAIASSIGTGFANSNQDQPYMADQPYEAQAAR